MHRENFFSKGEDGADDTTATQQQKNGGILYVYIYMCVCILLLNERVKNASGIYRDGKREKETDKEIQILPPRRRIWPTGISKENKKPRKRKKGKEKQDYLRENVALSL